MTTLAEAQELAAHYVEIMDTLIGVIQQETDLVRVGRLAQADKLGADQGRSRPALYRRHVRLRANQARMRELAPDLLEALVRRHDTFRALLQINLTVLATAHAVSEGIVRGVSGELARKSSPQTYGASGRRQCARTARRPAAGGEPPALRPASRLPPDLSLLLIAMVAAALPRAVLCACPIAGRTLMVNNK